LKIVYLGLGSNLGDRRSNLNRARERIESPECHILRASSLYETAPRDVLDQPKFLNQVIEVDTGLFPRMLHTRLQQIEREIGRKPTVPKGPRVIDLDILLFGNSVIATAALEIPHPRMAERRFVLEPLAELAPDLRHPVTRQSVREMLGAVMDQQVKRLED
jgi:2-amino-4-hydroxy-6-hydroxymethyldihydropteridine diphosphokinase